MLAPAYPIHTERLLLRPFTPDDVDDVFAYQSREDGMRQEAHLVENEWFKGAWSDELDFAIPAGEWTR